MEESVNNKIIINKEYTIGKIEPELWGSFIEHMGRAVYGGIYEPTNACANEKGFRKDVIEAVKELGVPIVRYPGGNFLSGYNWKDGIGKNRPVKLDLAWGQTEPNRVGLHEFCDWATEVGTQVMMSVNLGTGTPKDAAEIVEYCNIEKGTQISDMRRENGREKPFAIKTWCLGNEMDGDWQICALTAEEYGRKAAETAKMMKWVDKDIRLVVCGSSTPEIKTYPEWDRVVLQHTYDYVDYLSLHRYYTYTTDSEWDMMSSHTDLDAFIKTVAATTEYVRAYKRSKKRMKLSLDEWNVWHTKPTICNKHVYNDINEEKWAIGPRRCENIYDLADAITFGGMMCTLINNADSVKAGCVAQLVNVIAPIMTQNNGGMFKQSIYYPYLMALRYAHGMALQLKICAEKRESCYGDTEPVYAACAYDGETYNLFVINKSEKEETYTFDFQLNPVTMIKRTVITGNLHDHNDFSDPNKVLPREENCSKERSAEHTVRLPAYSITLFRFGEGEEK